MSDIRMDRQLFTCYRQYLEEEEKSISTIKKYMHDLEFFCLFVGGRELNKEMVIRYKEYLEARYQVSSVNSMVAALNHFFLFAGWNELRVKLVKKQIQIYLDENKELTRGDYIRLIGAAKIKDVRLQWILQTICATGIRVSELEFIDMNAIDRGKAQIRCKGKTRVVFIPKKLCCELKKYAKNRGIKSGSIFVTKSGRPLDRSNIWKSMKALCADSGVSADKVYPHNLRHLFARTFYRMYKDIVRLADVLGHSSVNTTRIYTATSGAEQEQQMSGLGLVLT